MFFLIRLAVIYLVIGAGILLVQLNNTPCKEPLVLDSGAEAIGPPIDMSRLVSDRAYALAFGKQAVFWLPRFIDFVVQGNMPFKNFLFATDCKVGPQPAAKTEPPTTRAEPLAKTPPTPKEPPAVRG